MEGKYEIVGGKYDGEICEGSQIATYIQRNVEYAVIYHVNNSKIEDNILEIEDMLIYQVDRTNKKLINICNPTE